MKFKTVGAGKGCNYRSVDQERYDKEYERIFGKKKFQSFEVSENLRNIFKRQKDYKHAK